MQPSIIAMGVVAIGGEFTAPVHRKVRDVPGVMVN
jgi:hypothetical protein